MAGRDLLVMGRVRRYLTVTPRRAQSDVKSIGAAACEEDR
jgi:hypothetical protein